MVFPLLICWNCILQCCIFLPTTLKNPKTLCWENCCMIHHQENKLRTKLRLQFSTTILSSGLWDMFPGPTKLFLIGYSINSIWYPKIQIKYVDTKNQLADFLLKKFTRDEWNNLLHLFNISISSSASCSEAMSKRSDTSYSVDPVLWNEEIWKAKEKENCFFTSVTTTTLLKWFVARSSPSISPLSAEQ